MINQVLVYYQAWGECWHWGTLHETTSITGRPTISFEYSDEAIKKGLELSSYLLPLSKKLQQKMSFKNIAISLVSLLYMHSK